MFFVAIKLKKLKSLNSKIAVLLAVFVLSIIVFYACNKQDVKQSAANDSTQIDASMFERIKKSILENKQPVLFTVPVHQKADDVYFSDAAGNKIYQDDLRKMLKTSRTSVCSAQYDDFGDPVVDMFPLDFNLGLEGYGSLPCGATTDYQMSFTWFLAVHHSIQESNPYGAGGALIKSRFTLKLKNSVGTIIGTYSNIPITADKISNNGDYLFDNTRTLFSVLGTINIPASVAVNLASASITVSLATDCSMTPQLSGMFNRPMVNLNTLPCYRTDKVWINGGTLPGGVATVAGTFSICSPPAGFMVTNKHEIQYRRRSPAATSDAWDDQRSDLQPPIFINTYDMTPIPGTLHGSGKWIIRYRNVPANDCNPKAPWLTETWNF